MNDLEQRQPFSKVFVVAFVALLSCSAGCKTMTTAQSDAIVQERQARERSEQVVAENQQVGAEQNEERRQLTLKVRANELRRARSIAANEAASLLATDPRASYDMIQNIFEADLESVQAYEEARAAGNNDEFITRMITIPNENPEMTPLVEEVCVLRPMSDAVRAQFLVILGAAAYDLGKQEEGVANFEEAVRLDPKNRIARINFGKLRFEKRNWRGAIASWKHEFDDGYRAGEILKLTGQALYELGIEEDEPSFFEASRAALLEALVANPTDEDLLRWLGLLEYKTGRFESALQYFRAILSENPLDMEYLEYVANCYLELEDYRRAADQFELIYRVTGELTPQICRTLSDLYLHLDLPDRSALWLQRGYPDPRSMPASIRYALGESFLAAENLEQALEAFDEVPLGAEEYADGQAAAAEVEVRLGRHDAALHRLAEIFDSRPADGRIRLVAGDLHLEQREFAKALEVYNQAAGIPETKAEGFAGAAEAAYGLGYLRQAIDYYKSALKVDIQNAAYQANLREIKSEYEFKKSVEAASQP